MYHILCNWNCSGRKCIFDLGHIIGNFCFDRGICSRHKHKLFYFDWVFVESIHKWDISCRYKNMLHSMGTWLNKIHMCSCSSRISSCINIGHLMIIRNYSVNRIEYSFDHLNSSNSQWFESMECMICHQMHFRCCIYIYHFIN